MMGTVSRMHLEYDNAGDGPPSMILKSASEAPKSREVAAKFRLYEREVNFYVGLGEALEPEVPHAYFAEYAPETVDYAILMQDFNGYRTGDQVVGADIDQARIAVEALARFHAQYWDQVDDPALEWVPSTNSELVRESMIEGCIAGLGQDGRPVRGPSACTAEGVEVGVPLPAAGPVRRDGRRPPDTGAYRLPR